MSRTVAIDWDDSELRLVLANVQSSGLVVEDLLRVDLPENDSRPASELASTIKQLLAEHRFRGNDAVVAVPRSAVELRAVSVPRVPPNELPDIVRFQALREFSELSDNWPIDFLVDKSTDEQIHVMAAALSPKKFEYYRQVYEAAELKCVGLMLRPTASAAVLSRPMDEGTEAVRLVVDVLGRTAEFTVLRNMAVLFMREVRVSAEPGSAEQRELLLGEIRRTLSAARNQFHVDVDGITVLGSQEESRELASSLQRQLNLSLEVVNPLDRVSLGPKLTTRSVDSPGRFAAGIGMLSELGAKERQTIDFVNPRRAAQPPSKFRRLVLPAAIAATALLFILGGIGWRLWAMDTQIADMRSQIEAAKPALDRATKRIAEVESIDGWLKSDVQWLDELARLSRELPAARHVRLSAFNGSVLATTGDGRIELEGLSDSPDQVAEMERALAGKKRNVRGDEARFDGKDERYPWRFKEVVSVVNEVPVQKPSSRGARRTLDVTLE